MEYMIFVYRVLRILTALGWCALLGFVAFWIGVAVLMLYFAWGGTLP
jgi:hypothetical protein